MEGAPTSRDLLALLGAQTDELERLRRTVDDLLARQRQLAALAKGGSPPASEPPTEGLAGLCQHLEGLVARMTGKQLDLDPADTSFLGKARTVLERAGEMLPERLLDIVGFCDRLGAPLTGRVWRPLHGELHQTRLLLQALLAGWRLPQAGGPAPDAQPRPLPLAEAIVISTGAVDPQGATRMAWESWVPMPAATPALRAAWDLVEELHVLLACSFRRQLKDDLIRWQAALPEDSAVNEHLRHTLNLHTRWHEHGDGPAVGRALRLLQDSGLKPVALETGARFDPDLHDPKRFDRVQRSGDRTAGTVLGLRQIGLVDARGLPVQKCIVIVSG